MFPPSFDEFPFGLAGQAAGLVDGVRYDIDTADGSASLRNVDGELNFERGFRPGSFAVTWTERFSHGDRYVAGPFAVAAADVREAIRAFLTTECPRGTSLYRYLNSANPPLQAILERLPEPVFAA